MTRFNTIQEIQEAAARIAVELVQRHQERGHDLNPYCTPGVRAEFDRAYANEPRRSWDINSDWDYRYQVGRAVAKLMGAI